ncbi:YscQ/HrcQ family type III secretion apparatus protein, partial [Escherichia coli]|nr:YscQ/HrcQ family type III secretion apparatus protein [Escherichia coli]
NESEIYDENDDQMINSFEDLPVKIEFVLGKKIMNLYEIDELCVKRIISLLPESEKNIEIRVNGALTGYGELVEVDDKLGVEIHSWLSGHNNVKYHFADSYTNIIYTIVVYNSIRDIFY